MKKALLPITAAFFLASSAFADLTIVQQVQQDAGGQSQAVNLSTTMKIKGQKMRVDNLPQASTIVDSKTGQITALMHPQKTVMTIPGGMMDGLKKAQAEKLEKEKALVDPPKATGRKETISGYACDEYELTANGMKIQIWTTKDIPNAEKVFADFAAVSDSDPTKGMMNNKDLTGFPIRTVMEMPVIGKTTTTVISLNQDPVPDSDFTVPADYKAMQMPAGLPGMGQ